MNYLLIFLGGGLGSVARFFTSSVIGKYSGINFPWGTLGVNLIGAFLIGLIVEILGLKLNLPENWRFFLVTGFLGGFTTFSAFSLESSLMLSKGEYVNLIAYISLSVIGTITLVLLATHTARTIL